MPASVTPDAPLRLYRVYDADDVLLYIGLTQSFETRWPQHYHGWIKHASRVDLSEVIAYSRIEGKLAEAEAIKREVPLFNREHADVRHVEAAIRYAERVGMSTKGFEVLREKYVRRQRRAMATTAPETPGDQGDFITA